MWKSFKEFMLRGNVIDLAVAVIIGAMFGAVVDSLVKGLIDPTLAGLVGKPNFDEVASFKIGGSLVKPGMVFTALTNFILKAAVIFFALVQPTKKLIERMKKKDAEGPPPEPTAQEKLLMEIRDLLKQRA